MQERLRTSAEHIELVGNGRVIDGLRLRIVDPDTHAPREPGQVGEIWLAGASVAQGYWQKPELTERSFRAQLSAAAQVDHDPTPYLRTGDLGFIVGDELFVVGRIKDTLLVRGQNHYAEDLEEAAARAHPKLRPNGGAVFAIELARGEAVVLVHEVETRQLDAAAVVQAVRGAIAKQHGVALHAVVLIRARTLAKTTSGKIQRSAVRQAYLDGKLASAVHHWADRRQRDGNAPTVNRIEPKERTPSASSESSC